MGHDNAMTQDQVNILMVDDQPGKLLSYEAILSELGENLVKATSAREALEYLLKTDVAVVLMDVSMPEIDGFQLADMIRQHPRFQKTAIIFISAVHLSDIDRMKGYERGAVDYISVPVIPDLLRAKVSIFSELHRKRRELEHLNRKLEQRVEDRTRELQESEQRVRNLNRELKQRVAELETIMRVLPVGVGVAHNRKCDIITPNAVLAEMLGMKTGENISKNIGNGSLLPFEVFRGDQPISPDQLPMQRAAASGKPINGDELELRYHDGRVSHIVVSANPLFDDEGNVRGSVGAHIDLTEHKQMERTLRERAELLELASEAIVVCDACWTIRFWNSGAEAMYGWKREEAIGQNIRGLLKTTWPIPVEQVEAALETRGRWDGDIIHRTKDGREIVVASRQAAKRDGDHGVLEINRDITAQYQAEEALRKTERLAAMGRVAGIIAHEINNPLEAITNTFYLLRDHPSLNEEARYYAQLGEQELQRVTHIARQTLSFYRESQRAMPVSIPNVLDDVLELQSRQLQLSGIKVEKQYKSSGLVQGFPVELKQVFLNLVGNAVQAMPDGGRLRISVSEVAGNGQNRRVRVSICDTGKGIQPEDAKRLFEPFFTTKSTKGTGLGLWISKGIVQKYEGNIRFRSVRVSGINVTCFTVTLPAIASSQMPEFARYSSLSV